jgi:dihydroxyacid dehydratase/phosphogluconate dehydratase
VADDENDPATLAPILDSRDSQIYEIKTKTAGPQGAIKLTEQMLLNSPSGNLFAKSQNVGMGWNPAELERKEFLILSTQGGIRASDGTPVALGYHTGHWEVGLLVQAAAEELRSGGHLPFAAFCLIGTMQRKSFAGRYAHFQHEAE